MQGVLAQHKLDFKYKAENEKARCWEGGDQWVQQYGTIYVGDGRLKAIACNKEEEATIEAICICKEKKREEKEALAERKKARLAKKAAKEEAKQAKKAACNAKRN